MEESAVKKYNF